MKTPKTPSALEPEHEISARGEDDTLAPMNLGASCWVLVGAGAVNPLVQDLGVCLAVAAIFGVLFERLRIPTIAALLVAGVLVGPIGLSLVASQSNIETIANLGLTLLLFVIGLEVKPSSLLASGRALVVTGLVQVPLSIAVGAAVFATLGLTGWALLDGPYVALYMGVACAFSSTLLVVKFLQERLELDTISGRMCVGLLIFQDIWAIIFLALQPRLANPDLGPIISTFVGIGIVVLIAGLMARFVLPRVFASVAMHPELLVTLALGWCCCSTRTAWIGGTPSKHPPSWPRSPSSASSSRTWAYGSVTSSRHRSARSSSRSSSPHW